MGDIWWAYSGSLRDIDLELEMSPIIGTSLSLSENPHVVCEVNKRLFQHEESYRLHITEKRVSDFCVYCSLYTVHVEFEVYMSHIEFLWPFVLAD